MNGVIYVSDSGNTKIMGSKKVDATYVSIESSCPSSCSLKNEGCYSQSSFVGMHVKRLDKEASEMTPLQVAKAEAKAIDNSYKGGFVPFNRDMRLHVSGDSKTVTGTRIINKAVGRWKKRGGNEVWSYTHAWKHVPRKEWSNVSILASVSSTKEAIEAKSKGYAPAIVVAEHTSEKVYSLEGSDIKWIPCPVQTSPGGKEVACSDCRLCMKADWLFETNRGISFAAHGINKNKIKRSLTVLK